MILLDDHYYKGGEDCQTGGKQLIWLPDGVKEKVTTQALAGPDRPQL